MHSVDENLNVHFLLKYHGIQFNNAPMHRELEGMSSLESFAYLYSNLGAIVMRYNLTFSQRASALQQLVEADYSKNPVEAFAQGDDATSLFNCPKALSNSEIAQHNYFLEANAHQCIGRSRVSNEKMQRLIQHNSKPTHGEQKLWDIIHCPVWTVGIELHYQLYKQGFIYIACPPGFTKDERKLIDQLLRQGDFETIFEQGLKCIKCINGQNLVVHQIDKISIFFDDKKRHTQEDNQMSVCGDDTVARAPLGWIMFEKENAILPQWCCEDIMKISVLKKLGVNALNEEQKKLLFSGTLSDGPLISWKENRAFNCIYKVLLTLEHYHFDPTKLLNTSRINALQKRFSDALINEPDLVDDFLTGTVQQEMIQPLIKSRPTSAREEVPKRFSDSFEISINTMKAMAYALDIRDDEGLPVLRDVTVTHPEEGSEIDSWINGYFVYPSCNTGNHVATLLSTAILIAEHLLLEQLVKQAYLDCATNPSIENEHPLKRLLMDISINPEHLWSSLLHLAECAPKSGDTLAPILGVRYSYCYEFLQLLREQIGLKQLIELCEQFSRPDAHTEEVLVKFNDTEQFNLQRGLKHLYILGDYLQTNKATSVQNEGSRGINSGLRVLIPKIAPTLCAELRISPSKVGVAIVKARDRQKAQNQVTMEIIQSCPFIFS